MSLTVDRPLPTLAAHQVNCCRQATVNGKPVLRETSRYSGAAPATVIELIPGNLSTMSIGATATHDGPREGAPGWFHPLVSPETGLLRSERRGGRRFG